MARLAVLWDPWGGDAPDRLWVCLSTQALVCVVLKQITIDVRIEGHALFLGYYRIL